MRVYFIEDGRYIKIGRSKDPIKRVDQMQTGNPREIKLIRVLTKYTESEIHNLFETLRERGEWFRKTGNLKSFLEGKKQISRNSKGRVVLFEKKKRKPQQGGIIELLSRVIKHWRKK